MKPYTRTASALWSGSRQRGRGAISTPSAVLKKAPYASVSNVNPRRTNPAELIAAAHAGSFSMTLAHELIEAGYRPRQIDTTATVTMEDIAARWTMTQIHLDVVAAVPGVAECDFVDAALRAKANCPVSCSLNANISMRARLNQRGAIAKPLTRRNRTAAGPRIPQPIRPRRHLARNQARFPRNHPLPPTNLSKHV